MHDLVILYNSYIDSALLFAHLDDPAASRNAALVIYSLLCRNIMRMKGNVTKLIARLFDAEIGSIVRAIVKNFSTNNNVASVIFHETFLSDLSIEHLRYLCGFVSAGIHESLFLKCLASAAPLPRLRCVFEEFKLSEKFISEQIFRDEMKALVGNAHD